MTKIIKKLLILQFEEKATGEIFEKSLQELVVQ